MARLALLSEDDPEVEVVARESAELIKGILSPAQMKHKQLVEQHLKQIMD